MPQQINFSFFQFVSNCSQKPEELSEYIQESYLFTSSADYPNCCCNFLPIWYNLAAARNPPKGSKENPANNYLENPPVSEDPK
jgi:hypothetical protein